MPFRVLEFEATPNPNAVMCHLDQAICVGTLSYTRDEVLQATGADSTDPSLGRGEGASPDEPEEVDAVVVELLSIPGVQRLMLRDQVITITKAPREKWPTIKQRIQKTLATAEPVKQSGF